MRPQATTPAMFECAGETLLGMVHSCEFASEVGVVIVVGGPQYRVGSHRQFVQTGRSLAGAGHVVLRFDYRGMGDAEGDQRAFDSVSDDIRSAIDYLTATQGVTGVVLFGLCDAASANLIYCSSDCRVRGLILLNPWVRTAQGEAQSYLRHYYLQRLLSSSFWRKVRSREFSISKAISGLARTLIVSGRSSQGAGVVSSGSFIDRMHKGLTTFSGDILFLISGQDLTAQEFLDLCARHKHWKAAMQRTNVELKQLPNADHTFSARTELERANQLCIEWLRDRWGRAARS